MEEKEKRSEKKTNNEIERKKKKNARKERVREPAPVSSHSRLGPRDRVWPWPWKLEVLLSAHPFPLTPTPSPERPRLSEIHVSSAHTWLGFHFDLICETKEKVKDSFFFLFVNSSRKGGLLFFLMYITGFILFLNYLFLVQRGSKAKDVDVEREDS